MSQETAKPPLDAVPPLPRSDAAQQQREADQASGGQRPVGYDPARERVTPYDPDKVREETRSDLARIILYLLAFVIGGTLLFIGTGQLPATTLVQSIFPSLVTLAGTALGFYFGAQAAREGAKTGDQSGGQPKNSPASGASDNPSR